MDETLMASVPIEQRPRRKTSARPPGPPNYFRISAGIAASKDYVGYFTMCAERYGDVSFNNFLGLPTVFINHPELIESVLVTNYHKFRKSRDYQSLRLVLGNGLLTSEGDFWKRQRKLAQPAFHRERIAGYSKVMLQSTAAMLQSWHGGETRDIHQDLMRLTLEIVARCLFQADVSHVAGLTGEALDAAMRAHILRAKTGFYLPHWWPHPVLIRYRRKVAQLSAVIEDMVNQRRQSDESSDLLGMLLGARDEDGRAMDARQIRDEVMTLFLAGHETTANALSWMFYLLDRNPAADAALHRELDEVLGGRAPQMQDIPNLPYTAMVIKEAMRMYPPVWGMGRESNEPFELGGYRFEKDTYILISQYITHRDARFFPEPERFRPERWGEEESGKIPRFAYFPFGAGPRVCIGAAFANVEITLLLAAIAQQYRLRLDPAQKVAMLPSITLRPKYGMRMCLEPRGSRALA
ncbi:MAG: cytochrome P450 [Acidobacteriaceae bacterium]|nr:cytochrome P450 [Acidobacteriaceae bacterium]